VDASGRLWLHGRLENAIRTGTESIFPFGIERVIESLDGVKRAAVVPDGKGDGIVVFLEGEAPTRDLEAAVTAAARGHFNIDHVRIQAIEKIPVDMRHQSKADYPALIRMAGKRERR
jgi:acyl-coenzyme A synthetase/AMP-(fatty) acid ligase